MSSRIAPVKRDDYLRDRDVRAFLAWAEPLVTGACRLNHPAPDDRGEFETLFDSCRRYSWRGKSYEETVTYLGGLARRVRQSLDQDDPGAFHGAALEVLKWGGVVPHNAGRLEALGAEAIPLLRANGRLLDPDKADLTRVWAVQPMNAGFSKIYSLMLDGFPIYDSRVACALGSLVRRFCQETGCHQRVPKSLAFGIPPNQGKANRDPSCGSLSFSKIRNGGAGLYSTSNVMAAWILDALSRHGPFGSLGDDRQFALQSAMFMVGHAPLAKLDTGSEASHSRASST